MISKIAHIGVAVKNLEEVEKFYQEMLSLKITHREEAPGLKVSFMPVGDTAVEFLQSATPDGVIAKYIEKKGEGIHHLAYQVENIDEALAELKAKGVSLIDEKPRRGAHNSRIAFINPKNTFGVLVELVEPEKKHP